MNPDDFENSPAGQLIATIDSAMAFVPNPLPPAGLDMAKLIAPLERATLALGELSGIGRNLVNPELLIRPFSRVEAVASSKIEGTVTPAPELLMLERDPDSTHVRSDTREINNYNLALRFGLQRLNDLPLSKRLFSELHKILLEGVSPDRGARFIPGEYKKEQNWIGARTIQGARFVPPPPAKSIDALDELERFIHSDDETLPLLIKLALIHYQFETIHPFPDGNGRVGRLIIPLMLCERKVMAQPLLYLSTFFEKNYDRYIDSMFDVSKSGHWNEWIEFFLLGIETASLDAARKARALQDLHTKYSKKTHEARSSALLSKLVDSLFAIPVMTIPIAARELSISYNAAKNSVQKLVDLNMLMPGTGSEKPQWFFADEIIQLVNSPDS